MVMDEEVVSGLGKMKLTVDEEETIKISDEGRREEIESCSLSLIGKFLTCKHFNKRAAKNTLKKAWGLEDGVQIVEVGSNLFQFKFKSEFDLERIFKGGPWSFDNQLLLLTKWRKGMNANNVRLNQAPIWIQIWGAPFDMNSTRVATEVGSRLGEVVEVERRQQNQDKTNLFMRVKVALPISKPLRRGGFIAGSDGERFWITYKYERLPMFCHFCGLLGHDLRHCPGYFSLTRSEGEVECQYGDWLKATGGRYRSPPKRTTESGHEPNLEKHDRGDHAKSSTALVQAETVAARESKVGNPREKEMCEDGNSEIHGNGTLHNPIITAVETLNKESIGVNSMEESNVKIKLNSTAIKEIQQVDQGDVSMQNGPNNQKSKPTWVRLRRMDCGPKEIEFGEKISVLGKRMATQLLEKDSLKDDEAQPGKRGKADVYEEHSKEISARVDYRPCREQ